MRFRPSYRGLAVAVHFVNARHAASARAGDAIDIVASLWDGLITSAARAFDADFTTSEQKLAHYQQLGAMTSNTRCTRSDDASRHRRSAKDIVAAHVACDRPRIARLVRCRCYECSNIYQ